MKKQYDKTSRIAAANKRAFDDVFGDPTAVPEGFWGMYQTMRGRGAIAALRNNFDEGRVTRNPAAPSALDFLCDVEKTVERELQPEERPKFVATYITETGEGFTQLERIWIEQRIGGLLRKHKISPVSRYFRSVRRSSTEKNHTN